MPVEGPRSGSDDSHYQSLPIRGENASGGRPITSHLSSGSTPSEQTRLVNRLSQVARQSFNRLSQSLNPDYTQYRSFDAFIRKLKGKLKEDPSSAKMVSSVLADAIETEKEKMGPVRRFFSKTLPFGSLKKAKAVQKKAESVVIAKEESRKQEKVTQWIFDVGLNIRNSGNYRVTNTEQKSDKWGRGYLEVTCLEKNSFEALKNDLVQWDINDPLIPFGYEWKPEKNIINIYPPREFPQ